MNSEKECVHVGREQLLVLLELLDAWDKTGPLPVADRAETRALVDLFGALQMHFPNAYDAAERPEMAEARRKLGERIDLSSFAWGLIRRWEADRQESPEASIPSSTQVALQDLETLRDYYLPDSDDDPMDPEALHDYVVDLDGGMAWSETEEYVDRLPLSWREAMTFREFCEILSSAMRGDTPEQC